MKSELEDIIELLIEYEKNIKIPKFVSIHLIQ